MHAEETSAAADLSSTDLGSPERREEPPVSPSSRGESASSLENYSVAVEDDDEHIQESQPRTRRRRPGSAGSVADEETPGPQKASSKKDDVTAWLSLGKQAAESKCRELEAELVEARHELTKQDARFVSCV